MRASFHHLLLHVHDIRRTRSFYERLGMEVLAEEPGYLRLSGGAGFVMGVEERSPKDIGAPGVEIEILVPDVDALAARLRDEGVPVTAPSNQPWGGRHAWLHDPDGYRLSIYSETAA